MWRPRGERLSPAFALQRYTAPTACVMVWGAITYNTRSPLVWIRGTMTAQRYVHDILQPHVLPLMQRLPGAIFQQENARPHTVQQEMAFPNRTKKQQVRTEIKDILDSIISICEEKDEETYCTEKDDILDTLEEILVSIDTQLMPSVVNSDFEIKNQGSSHSLVSARSAEVKLPTLSLPIFSGVTEEWLAFSDLFEAAVSNNNDLTGAQKLQYLKGSLKSDALKIINSLSITNDNFEIA
ncbi:DUF1758 domain-containing protein [Trichonephila clavipes]|nr:DUF1758 domain-containing protein [Trichonephila clavipes]